MADETNEIPLAETISPVIYTPPASDATSQEKVLEALDNRKFSWYHVKAILVSGVGFFTDAYDLFIINMVVPMIGYAYYGGKMSTLDQTLLKGSAVIGTFIGQLTFGLLGDLLGRKKVYIFSLLLMIIGALASCVSASTVRGVGVVGFVCFWRLILGVGIGGDYPLSAVITSEFSSKMTRGRMMAAVFAFQGWGNLTAAIVSLVVLACFKGAIEADPLNVDYCWRICLGIGIIPAIMTVYIRSRLPETPRYTMQVQGNVSQAASDVASVTSSTGSVSSSDDILPAPQSARDRLRLKVSAWFEDFRAYFGRMENFKVLFGTATSWFLLDIAFYGLNLNQSLILSKIGYVSKTKTVYDTLFVLASGNAIINMLGNVPGYWVCILFIEIMGRKTIQLMGFIILTVIFVILSAAYNPILNVSIGFFVFLYTLGQFFFNFGPNTTTYIVPGEVFPTRYKSTGHGISAATGKLGAIISSYAFTPVVNGSANGLQVILGALGAVMFVGIFTTLLIPETKGRSLEELGSQDDTSAA